jgi:HK97 gp10 family phage protein
MADEFLKGLGDLTAALKDLPGNIEKNALRTGAFRAAQFMRDKVKDQAPVSSGTPPKGGRFRKYPPGTLKESIRAKRSRGNRGEVAAGVTGAFYTKRVEFGHVLKGHRPGKVTLGHVPANPFIRRAFEASKDEAADSMKRGIIEAIKKGLDKARAKAGV